MKNKLILGALVLFAYLGFLMATLPSAWVLSQGSIAKNIALSGISGSIWHTKINQVSINGIRLNDVEANLSALSLVTLTPKLSVTFGDALSPGPEGALQLALSSDNAQIHDANVLVKANAIAQQLTLPLPMTAQGDVTIAIARMDVSLGNQPHCTSATGTIDWSKAGVVALEQNIPLGNLKADVGCENNALAIILNPDNNLGLTFNAYLRSQGNISGNGYLQPGAKFPRALNDALPFLGNKDSQGRYRLSF